MTALGCGSSRQTLRNAENSIAAAWPTAPRKSARSVSGSRFLALVDDVGGVLPCPGTGEGRLARLGIEPVQHVRAHLDVEEDLGSDAVGGGPGAPVLGVDLDLDVDEARRERRGHAVGDAAVRVAVAAGHDRGAFGELVLAAPAVADELEHGRLDHGDAGGELFQVDQVEVGAGRGRQEFGMGPAGDVWLRRARGCRAGRRGRGAVRARRSRCGTSRPRPAARPRSWRSRGRPRP